ncbi:MAG: hypothetical protein ACOCYO_09335, partial [Bacteroidota bacterium]
PVRVYWKDKDLRFLGANRAFLNDLQIKKPELIINKNEFDFLPDKQMAEKIMNRKGKLYSLALPFFRS